MNWVERAGILFSLGLIIALLSMATNSLSEINGKLNLKTGKIQCMYGLEDKDIKACVVDGKLINFADD